MNNSHVVRVGVGLVATLALGLGPATVVQANAAPVTAVVVQKAGDKQARCWRYVEPWTGPVKRCTRNYTRSNHADLIWGGIWAPHFEPTLTPFGQAGTFFVYVGRTPVGWVEMPATGEFGGTITLATEYGDYRKGTQRIALYDSRGRLVAWDWITLQWDW